ncbi:kelch domain-containing protein 1-like isoform X2 [Tachysurus fulvidraco]|uniref:kelch domain-containing protein 1-like isoform X2 n=1 Tax=Tachysurus fulvidraco TaxID=1234273 RepID=UPI001FEF991D|nr:kelch domain-containing protein 1-like isoform X2 [Tachysurus fulvidraco]
MDIVTELPDSESHLMAAPGRSDHVALLLGNVMHVWGGLKCEGMDEIALPTDEIWLYDLESGVWSRKEMGGELPPQLFQTCGSLLNGTFYVFGGRDDDVYLNQMYYVDLQDGNYTWKKLNAWVGTPPSPRDRHSCWTYMNRLIYFGGYGYKTIQETINNERFAIEGRDNVSSLHSWGWNNEVHIFEPNTATWTVPETQGEPPKLKASLSNAILGSRGYICGGLETQTLEIHCLDLDTWTWIQIEPLAPPHPIQRSLHTLTPTSDHTLFLFGGVSMSGQVLSDGWEFDTVKKEWIEKLHPHKNKPRFWHSAVQGMDYDVLVYGGSQENVYTIDTIAVLRSRSVTHSGNVLVFQSQPYSLTRLCEDCIGKHGSVLQEKVSSLPPKIQETVNKRMHYFKTKMQKKNRSARVLSHCMDL